MSAATKTTTEAEHTPTSATPESSFKHLYENLILIDLAANLVHKKYSRDQENVIQRAKDAGQYARQCGHGVLIEPGGGEDTNFFIACSGRYEAHSTINIYS